MPAQMTDELKNFLQQGFHAYGNALVAIAEFRRQISSPIREVLEEFSVPLSELGLSVDGFKLKRAPMDDGEISASYGSIELEKNSSGHFYANYHILWDLEMPKETQVAVGVWAWASTRPLRDSLYADLQKEKAVLKNATLRKDPNGLSRLVLYIDPNQFYRVHEHFRLLLEDWVELITRIGGVARFSA
jgi:hypothetical protein